MNIPRRGEVWLADLGMIAKVRPVLVINVPFGDSDYALFQVIPHTTAIRNSQFEVGVQLPWLAMGVFNIQGSLSVPRSNLLRPLGTLTDKQLLPIEKSFRQWLGL
jgi:mRNA interferase MazF